MRKFVLIALVTLLICIVVLSIITYNIERVKKAEEAIELAKQSSLRILLPREEIKKILHDKLPYLTDEQLVELRKMLDEHKLDSAYVLEVLGGIEEISKKSNAAEVFAKEIKNKDGVFEIVGWKSNRLGQNSFLVSYTIVDSAGESGWFFEVNTKEDVVRYVNEDSVLFSHYEQKFYLRKLETSFETFRKVEKKRLK